ncbi:MAG: PAS domain-containing protein [Hyphomicrobiales bacterium]|nr:PAS domain-containing protein [Hyphomicrobiales bacterium]
MSDTLDSRTKTDLGVELGSFVLDRLPDPVLLIRGDERVVEANRAAVGLFGEAIKGKSLTLAVRHPEILELVRGVLGGRAVDSVVVSLGSPVTRFFEVQAAPLRGSGVLMGGAVLILHDVTMARNVEEMRADFVANVSHELRSPLTALIGFIETLRGAARDDPDARERFLAIMETEANRMARLVNDLLSLTKVESSEHIPPRGEVDVAALLDGVRDVFLARARERDNAIVLDLADGLPAIAGDEDELVEVFHNLVDNALKYGREGTEIHVSARAVERIPDVGGAGVAVTVRNEGEGVAPEHIPRLTERFYRIDKGRSRSMGGTGLGLAIVKHIVNHHRGRLKVESRPGIDSSFTVYLPAKHVVPRVSSTLAMS